MKIKRLDIVGFKSFMEKTSIIFPEGISAVVGPNGCGKSNLVDAIRWVMGEQSIKQLRGRRMEDVIFSGTSGRYPLNMAEVSLTILDENGNLPEQYHQFSEIMVTRRLFRSGESEYLINKRSCRLKDIHNIFLGTGVGSRSYAVIQQGSIGSLIDADPDERRLFIEEAAGVSRYRVRRKETLQKIERASQDLVRIKDILNELNRQKRVLKRQADKAEKYKEYRREIKDLEVVLACHEYSELSRRILKDNAVLRSLKDSDLEHSTRLAKLDARIEKIRLERSVRDKAISEQKSRRLQLQRYVDKAENDILHYQEAKERLAELIQQFQDEKGKVEKRHGQIDTERLGLEQRIRSLKTEEEMIRRTIRQKEEERRALKEEMYRLIDERGKKRDELLILSTHQARYRNALEIATRNSKNISQRVKQIRQERTRLKDRIVKLEKRKARVNDHYQKLSTTTSDLNQRLKRLKERLQDKQKALHAKIKNVQILEAERQNIRSQYLAIRRMHQNYDWFKGGVKNIMKHWRPKNRDRKNPALGVIAEVVFPRSGYDKAVEAALGEMVQYIIVEDQKDGREGIEYLRSCSAGRGGFVPLNTVKHIGKTLLPNPCDEPPSILKYVRIREGYEDLVASLLGNVMVAEDLDEALKLWNANGSIHAVVTVKGDLISREGIMIGGSLDESSGILAKRREMDELEKELASLEERVAVGKSEQKEMESEGIDLESEVQQTQKACARYNKELVKVEKELYRIEEDLKHAFQYQNFMQFEDKEKEGERIDLNQEVVRCQVALSKIFGEATRCESRIDHLNSEIEKISHDLDILERETMEFKLHATAIKAEKDNAEETMRRLADFQKESKERLENLRLELERKREEETHVEKRLAETREKIVEVYDKIRSIDTAISKDETEYQELDANFNRNSELLREIQVRRNETQRKIQLLEMEVSKTRMKQEHLIGRIEERYRVRIDGYRPTDPIDPSTVKEREEKLRQLNERLARIGEVNLVAIEEYKDLEERFQFLDEQRRDLEDAIGDLNDLVRRINRNSQREFMQTVEAINQKLQEVFPKLFNGGTAHLLLTKPDRPLEGGVEFLIHPPGKKLTRMSLLSGGEKALATLSLIFAVFLIKPTAFCLFDEIDAHLDDVNLDRFNELLRDIGKRSQVIMVTHNKRTMEVADTLFGITMERNGVSKIVSVRLTDKDMSGE